MRFVVTGANGYIGSVLIKQLLDDKFEVVALDVNDTYIDKRAFYKKVDIFNELPEDLIKDTDTVIHLAWRNGFNHNHPSHLEDLHKHYSFLQKVIEAGCKNISVLGTMHEVGYYEGKIKENVSCNPMSLYGIAKNSLRQAIECYIKDKDVCFHWLRAFYITGNDRHSNSVFGKLIRSAEDGQKEFPFTSGKNQYDFISIEELCHQIIAASTQKRISGIINLCSGIPMSLGDRINQFISDNHLDIKLIYGVYPDRPYDSPIVYGDNSIIKQIIEEQRQLKKSKVLVTGAEGQLGYDVMNELKKRGIECVGSDIIEKSDDNYIQLDITDKSAVEKALSEIMPDAVIHCAAWTAVDAAEDEDNKTKVYAVNVIGTRNIAEVCKQLDCKMIYISTDYVFNGQGSEPWKADCEDFAPLNYYGKTKLEGELAVAELLDKFFIVRIAWVFGLNGKNFIKTMINVGKKHDTVRVVNDQIGTPTYTYDLARLLVDMIETNKYGYYHATNEGGYISWYDFCCEIYRQYGLSTKVIPVTTEEYGLSKATRPFNSRLDKSKLKKMGFKPLPKWQDAVNRYLKEIE